MIDRKITAKLPCATLDLHRAADVRRDNCFGAAGQNVARFAQTDLVGHFGLRKHVASCCAAANFGFSVGQELEARHAGQQLQRFIAHPLSVN